MGNSVGAIKDDNIVVKLSYAKMRELEFSQGDMVMLQGEKGQKIVCAVYFDVLCTFHC
jgi:formylmethanofuran dehydrogenase subunit D